MRLSLIFGGLAAAAALHAQPITIFNDTFSDGERLTQNLPSSVAWYTSNAARTNLAVRNGALTLVGNNNDRDVWGYFPSVGLNIGDSLTFTVTFKWTNTPPNLSTPGFKIALCSTNGIPPLRADGVIPHGNYQGYGAFTNPADATAGTIIRKRDGPGAALAASTLLELTDGSANTVVWNALRSGLAGTQQGGTSYTAVLKITRTGPDAASISTSITGGALSPDNTLITTDAAAIVSTFDTVAIDAADSAQYGDLQVTRAELVYEMNTARLVNLSILTSIPLSGDTFTLGYVAGGAGTSGPKRLVIRAAGPSLGALGFPGTLDDPRIELFTGTQKTDENDNWGGGSDVREAMAAVGAFAYTSTTSRDAALLANVAGGANNSVRVSANGAGTGAVIAEIYDASGETFSASTPRLINLSVLKHLGSGLTVGFYIGGAGTRTVLIRAIGPTLSSPPFGVAGAVADPQLTLYSGSTPIASNDNWGGTSTLIAAFNQVAAFALPATSHDAALVATLSPGSYTVQVSGVGGTTGVALIEVYEVP